MGFVRNKHFLVHKFKKSLPDGPTTAPPGNNIFIFNLLLLIVSNTLGEMFIFKYFGHFFATHSPSWIGKAYEIAFIWRTHKVFERVY